MADSGIGQDGVSFAESLTTEIMASAMVSAGHAVSRYVSRSLRVSGQRDKFT